MEEVIKLLNPSYELIKYVIKQDVFVFTIESSKDNVCCPYCGTYSKRVHSTYQREIQDLPIQEKEVVLLVNTRKMFCNNPECSHRTFSEQHPFVLPKAKKTERLLNNIVYTSVQLSSVNASKQLQNQHIQVSKSSICEMLKKNARPCG